MPRHQKAMKDVAACDKPRLGGKQPVIRGFPNGGTHERKPLILRVLLQAPNPNFQFPNKSQISIFKSQNFLYLFFGVWSLFGNCILEIGTSSRMRGAYPLK